MADKKISELVSITGSATAADDYFVVVDTSGAVTYKISREELNNAIEQDVLENISITNLTSDLNTNGNDIKFGDNDKAIFGDAVGGDLQIYHDGSNSYINEQGTGNLKIIGSDISIEGSGETHATFVDDGAVTLYHNNAIKFATTATGVDAINTAGSSTSRFGSTYNTGANDGTLVIGNGGSGKAMLRFDYEGTNTDRARIGVSSSAQQLEFYTAGDNERMRIDSSGRVGIGCTPSDTLEVSNASNYQLRLTSSGQNYQIGRNGSDGLLHFYGNQSGYTGYVFSGINGERMRIDSSGNVGIGTTNPNSGKLHVSHTTGTIGYFESTQAAANVSNVVLNATQTNSSANATFQINHGTTAQAQLRLNGDSSFAIHNKAGLAESMRIDSSGNVGIGTSSPTSNRQLTLYGNDAGLQITGSAAGSNVYLTSTPGSAANFYFGTTSAKPIIFVTNGENAERMRIDSNGNVGIGHTTPQFGLTMAQGNGDSARIGWEDGSNNKRASIICASSSDSLQFHTGTSDTERMRITSSGSLLVGSTAHEWSGSMAAQIDGIKGLAVFSSGASSEVIACWNRGDSGTRYQMWFADSTSAGLRGSITTNGSSTSFNTTSDYRLKTAVNYDWDATTRLKQLKPARFEWIADGDDAVPVDGFLAHEVQDIVPEAITGTKDGMRDEEYEVTPAVLDDDGNEVTPAVMGTRSVPDHQGIDQSKVVPLLTKALIEAVEKIEQLETRLAALEAN